MRIDYLAAMASAGLLLGCAGPAEWGGMAGFGSSNQNTQVADAAWKGASNGAGANGYASADEEPKGWTDRVVSTLTQNPLKTLGWTGGDAGAKKIDSISLDYPTGAPTPELLLSMASLTSQAGDPARAQQLYNQVLATDPSNAEALLGLARIEDAADRFPSALEYYQRAAAANPNNANVLNHLGLCLARMQRHEEALLAIHGATKLEPKNPLYRNNIANVLVALNQLDNAAAELGVVHPPAVAQYNLAVLLHQQGRADEAARYAAGALRLDPQFQPAQNLLAVLAPASSAQSVAAATVPGGVALTSAASTTVSSTTEDQSVSPSGAASPAPRYPATGYSPWPTVGSAQPAARASQAPRTASRPSTSTQTVEMPVSDVAASQDEKNLSLLPPVD